MKPSHRSERLADEVRAQLGTIISRMGDPRIGFATVTEVRLSADLRHAHVLVSVLGDEEAQKQSIKRLEAAHHYLRHELAHQLTLRFTPDLTFELDRGLEYSARVDKLLRRASKKQKAPED